MWPFFLNNIELLKIDVFAPIILTGRAVYECFLMAISKIRGFKPILTGNDLIIFFNLGDFLNLSSQTRNLSRYITCSSLGGVQIIGNGGEVFHKYIIGLNKSEIK